jgi:LPXTG-site transpeptidase (sortase) family protein
MGPDDTLDIGRIRLKREYPVAGVQPHQATDPVIHPEAAAAARARIAALGAPQNPAEVKPGELPSIPTSELILDKPSLAEDAEKHPVASGTISRRKIPSAVRPMIMAVGVFLIVLLLFKAPIILSQLGYSFGSKNNAPAVTASSSEVVPAANTITIPKINVQAPVNYEPSMAEADIQKSLESGVVHYGSTALPGQVGNVAIFGHSSNDWWEPGNYKFVFVLLDKLAPGDQITVDYNSHQYIYEVTGSKVVEPTDVGVLNSTPDPELTLITCTPPGTSLKRLVVTAKQISPDPKKATSTTTASASSSGGKLPSSAPDFLSQLSQGWTAIFHSVSSLFGGDTSSPSSSPSTSPSTTGQLPTAK